MAGIVRDFAQPGDTRVHSAVCSVTCVRNIPSAYSIDLHEGPAVNCVVTRWCIHNSATVYLASFPGCVLGTRLHCTVFRM